MAYLIKNANVFNPAPMGVQDILVVDKKIVAMGKDLTVTMPDLEVVDAKGMFVTPGFIDQHIHITGGGGEGGPKSRTPEIVLSELIEVGTTSIVGVSGTDSVTRSIEALLAKTRALKSEGISAWMHTSNYAFPPTTLTGSVRQDLFCVPECLGVKIAMADHRSSFPTLEQILHLLTDIRVGGMIAGKVGFLHIHNGEQTTSFDIFNEIVDRGFPIRHIRPTHCGRHAELFNRAIEFAKRGGYIDVTSGGTCRMGTPADAIQIAWDAGVDKKLLTFSSDGHGSVPRFNDQGVMVGLGTAGVACNLREVKRLIERGCPVEDCLALNTRNPARALDLQGKGELAVGMHADINFFDENWELQTVFAKGVAMMRNKELLVKGTFEE